MEPFEGRGWGPLPDSEDGGVRMQMAVDVHRDLGLFDLPDGLGPNNRAQRRRGLSPVHSFIVEGETSDLAAEAHWCNSSTARSPKALRHQNVGTPAVINRNVYLNCSLDVSASPKASAKIIRGQIHSSCKSARLRVLRRQPEFIRDCARDY
jgi:hypothetical protein